MVAGTALPCLLAKVRVNLHVFGCFLLLYLQQDEETDTKQPTKSYIFVRIRLTELLQWT